MNIFEYVKKLTSRIFKDDVVENDTINIKEFNENVLESYKIGSEHFKSNKITSNEVIGLSVKFYSNVKIKGNKANNFITDLYNSLLKCKVICASIERLNDKYLEAEIVNGGITAKKAALIKASDAMSFITSFSLDFLLYVYDCEVVEKDSIKGEKYDVTPAMKEYVNSNILKFFKTVSDYSVEVKEFEDTINEIPEVIISEKSESSVSGLYESHELDPFAQAHVIANGFSPMFFTRGIIAQFQVNRYKENKLKKQQLEYKLLLIQNLDKGENSASLINEIEITKGRIEKLSKMIREEEEAVGIS